jgi:hypothetical protein
MNEAMEEWRIKTRTSSIFSSVFFLIFLKAHIFVPSPASCQKDLRWWYWHKIMSGDITQDGWQFELGGQLRNVRRGRRTGQKESRKGKLREEGGEDARKKGHVGPRIL